MRILSDRREIASAQRKLSVSLKKQSSKIIPVILGYPGGNFQGDIYWFKNLGLWYYLGKESGRHQNYFGIKAEEPPKYEQRSIVCEANVPFSGLDRRCAGSFAKDANGNIYLIHRGRLGGGRKGIGKALFHNNFEGRFIEAIDGNKTSQVALMSQIGSPRIANQIRHFVSEVKRIKSLARKQRNGAIKSKIRDKYSKEFHGTRKYRLEADIETAVDHGLIVEGLRAALSKLGHKIANDRQRDLYVLKSRGGALSTLFEIKTSTSLQSIYTGVGQLLVNSLEFRKLPRLILTVPDTLDKSYESIFKKLRIKALRYSWTNGKPIFPSIRRFRL